MKSLISIVLVLRLIGGTVVMADDVPIESIKISVSSLKMEVSTSQKIKVITNPANAQSGSYDYISSDSTVITAGVGTIIANKVGKADITVRLRDSEISDTVTIEVIESSNANPNSTPTPTPTPPPSGGDSNNEISVRSVDIYQDGEIISKTIEIMESESIQFTAQVYPSNATYTGIRWKSDGVDVATVDDNGNVKAIKIGTAKISAISSDNGRSDTITIKVTPYSRYPDSISILPNGTPTFKTGETFNMKIDFSPSDTTERGISWFAYGGATIDQNGNVTILDKGKITVKAYTQDYKQFAIYEFDSTYADNHFTKIKEDFGVKSNKSIIIDFDTNVSSYSASQNIFAGQNANSENTPIEVKVYGKRIVITPINSWIEGENYIFIKSNLTDIYGNRINKNLKYKFNVRMVI